MLLKNAPLLHFFFKGDRQEEMYLCRDAKPRPTYSRRAFGDLIIMIFGSCFWNCCTGGGQSSNRSIKIGHTKYNLIRNTSEISASTLDFKKRKPTTLNFKKYVVRF